MSEHSKIGASGAYRWFNCPGSVALIDTLPYEPPTSEYAKEGTAAHALAEHCLKNRQSPKEYLGEELEGVTVTEEMAKAVSVYLQTIIGDLNEEYLSISDVNIETKFHLKDIDPDAFGRNDASFGDSFYTLLRIYDYKHGKGVPVEVEGNKQLMYYALGAPESESYDWIELTVVQPRCEHKDGPVRRWRFPQSVLQSFKLELIEAIKRTRQKDAPIKDGDWCKFCPAMAICPAKHSKAQALAVRDFSPAESPQFPPVERLSMDQVVTILNYRSDIDDYLKAVSVHAYKLAESGIPIPGYKLVQRRSNRRWKDKKEVEKAFAGMGPEVFSKPEILSVAQLEKVVGAKAIAPYWEKPDTGHELVPESDKREPAKASAVEDFSEEDPLF